MINSDRKGKVGEREWGGELRKAGWSARRGQQHSGIEGEDVVSDLPIHWEVKRVQRMNVTDAVDQAIRDSEWKAPAVAHRRNHEAWKVTMPADYFLILLTFCELDKFEEYLRLQNVVGAL